MYRLERWIALLGLLLFTAPELGAQTKVRRYDATKETDYGVVYRLPRTEIEAVVTVRERTYTPGPLSAYADRYLNKKASDKPRHTFELVSARLYTVGRPDSTQQYLVSLTARRWLPSSSSRMRVSSSPSMAEVSFLPASVKSGTLVSSLRSRSILLSPPSLESIRRLDPRLSKPRSHRAISTTYVRI